MARAAGGGGPVSARVRASRPTLEAQALVPVAQGAGIGAGVSAGTLAVAVLLAIAAHLPWWVPPVAALLAGLLAFAAGAVLLTLDHRRLLWAVEGVTRLDLDRDNHIGKPPAPRFTTVEVIQRHPTRIKYCRLPFTDDELTSIARAVLRPGAPFSRRSLPDGLVSGDSYQTLIDRLLEAGLLVWVGRGPEAGVQLTAAGRHWLSQYLA